MIKSFSSPLTKKSTFILAVSLFGLNAGVQTKENETPTEQPKNIIMIVADGMGPVFPTAYRYYFDDENTPLVERTIFDQFYVGSASTYPATESGYISTSVASGAALATGKKKTNLFVTDSAASATALATGVKTYNKAIGVDQNKKPQLTVLEWAKSIGKKTGIAVTSQIVHATPASYIAKNVSRKNYNPIADDYFDLRVNGKFKVDVMLGGGTKYFIRDDRNLKDEFVAAGYQYIDSYDQLSTLTPEQPVLGLFAKDALPAELDSKQKNRLTTLAKTAIKQLENENGFFLLLEASQVDWGAHSNDIAYSMGEMKDLAATMTYLKSYVASNPDTLVVLTADHNTGGFTIGARGVYKWQPEYLKNFKSSPNKMAKRLAKKTLSVNNLSDELGFALKPEELKQLEVILLEHTIDIKTNALSEDKNKKNLVTRYYEYINKIIDLRTNSGWTTKGHTGIDVPVYAFGKGKEKFAGFQDNIEIADKIFALMGKSN
ncbi:alkaline phosphatase [Thalassotalea sp. ND16A]|uniref:alkaline phosphatase n=1 Tax=Thalassotalea sp. ND16A TaxID=1535422 RepID=UPI00051D0A12|nr:alkaline phosphatase [Thalassotalea sp. ND16A]KGJ98422.1 Alkaline phosphatase [Thalassotalea sp. ND16A]